MKTYTKKEVYEALKEIGSTNLKEKELFNFTTNETKGVVVEDLDRNYYWVLHLVAKDQYQIVDQGSIFL